MRTQILSALTLVAASGIFAAEIFKADGEKDSAKKLFVGKQIPAETDAKTYTLTGHNYVYSKKIYKIDPTKKYVLKGKFRNLNDKPAPLYFGLILCDAKNKYLSPHMVNPVVGTETKLAAACKKTDKVLKLQDASKWKKYSAAGVAFEADLSGKYADLPTKNTSTLSSRGITSIKKVGNIWEVTLKGPVGKDYPAGTAVREHLLYGGYMYCAASNSRPGKEMKQLASKPISKKVTFGAPTNAWWPGTEAARVVIIANYGDKTGKMVTEFDDIILEESDK